MLAKLRARLCFQDDVDADGAEPAVVHAKASVKDLWQVAFDGLEPERKRWLAKEERSPAEVIEKPRPEREIRIRNVAEKILASTLNVQEIVKAVVSFDPSGCSSAAWAIVPLGMTMVRSNIERKDAIFEASEYLADMLAYFTIIGNECQHKDSASDEQLEVALIGVYTAILDYAAEVRKTHEESLAGVENNEILEWLSQTPYSDAQNNSRDHRVKGTGDWLMESYGYKHWKSHTGGIVWLHGRVKLRSTVIEDISQMCRDDQRKRCAYWYFQFNVREIPDCREYAQMYSSTTSFNPTRRTYKEDVRGASF
ncbi:uncharacterized protein BDV17DRAFT_292009 [Aspergillus undulatus]|uniref:uncharacterized protein n=1 Tax=Aspergillus undulatus TaxID=1810928 RepID=UPI003CCD9D90